MLWALLLLPLREDARRMEASRGDDDRPVMGAIVSLRVRWRDARTDSSDRDPRFTQPHQTEPSCRESGAGGRLLLLGIDEEGLGLPVHDLARDHHFLDPVEPREIEHGFEQDAFHDRPKATGARLALDRLL